MRLVRFSYRRQILWGKLEEDTVLPFNHMPWASLKPAGKAVSLSKVKLLAPYAGGKIILAGLNYKDHAKELKMALPKEPVIFMKPPTSVIGPGDKIIYPVQVRELHFEAELAFVIRKKAKNIKQCDAEKYILGYTALNDVTARDIQRQDGQWTRAKSFDTFCPLGPWIDTAYDWHGRRITAMVNGSIRQDSSTDNLIFSPEYLLEFISSVVTLNPGDIISTGTPPGVGSMHKRDKVCISIDGLGNLVNYIF